LIPAGEANAYKKDMLYTLCQALGVPYISSAVDATAKVSEKDITAVANVVARAAGHKQKLDAAAIKYLVSLAAKPGAFRNVVSRIENVAFFTAEKRVVPTYSVAQLDYVAMLSGDSWTIKHTIPPFGNVAAAPQKLLRKKVM
jgi:hypothetical protein